MIEQKVKCSLLNQSAAYLAKEFGAIKTGMGYISFGAAIGTGISGLAEFLSGGADTPVTVAFFGTSTGFAAGYLAAGAAESILNSVAYGNDTALANFDWSQTAGIATSILVESSRIPVLRHFAEALGQLAEKGADLSLEERTNHCP